MLLLSKDPPKLIQQISWLHLQNKLEINYGGKCDEDRMLSVIEFEG